LSETTESRWKSDEPPENNAGRRNLRRAVGKLGGAFSFPAGRRNFGQAARKFGGVSEDWAARRSFRRRVTIYGEPSEN
jgi:hypothetical protein